MFKQLNLAAICLLTLSLLSLSPPHHAEYVPILMKRSELEKSITATAPKSLQNPGKIYVKGDTLYIVEKFKGIHVILNHDPSNPENKHFIRIPGIVDVAVKNHILFADNAVDLVSLNIKNLDNMTVLDRKRNVFPELTPPHYDYMPGAFSVRNRPANTVIVEWKKNEQ